MKERSLENKDLCQTHSTDFDMSKDISKVSPNWLKRWPGAQSEKENHQQKDLYRIRTGYQRES